jgi:hypothetical protein
MFNIATESPEGHQELLVGIDGKPMTWNTDAEARNQIECFHRTHWNNPPKNFRWVILPEKTT